MRVTQLLQKRFPTRRQYENTYSIPFQDVLPIELRDRVSNKVRKDKARPCISELTVLLQCFKESDFSQKRCAESMKAYYACIDSHNEKNLSLEKRSSITEVTRAKDLTPQEVNQLLKQKPLQ